MRGARTPVAIRALLGFPSPGGQPSFPTPRATANQRGQGIDARKIRPHTVAIGAGYLGATGESWCLANTSLCR